MRAERQSRKNLKIGSEPVTQDGLHKVEKCHIHFTERCTGTSWEKQVHDRVAGMFCRSNTMQQLFPTTRVSNANP